MKLNIYNKRYLFFAISAVIILIGLAAAFISGINLDIQFKGGSVIVYSYEGDVNTEDLQSKIEDALDVEISSIQDNFNEALDMQSVSINVAGKETLSVEQKTALDKLFAEDETYKAMNFNLEEEMTVDPSIGFEYLSKGIYALLIAAVLIVLYVWYRFRVMSGPSAGVMALVALFHDILIVFSAFVIFKIPLNENFIAVILTIIGYSINDTIVIYDRIRENLGVEQGAMPLNELVDMSLGQSLGRTINTSVATFGTMLITYVFANIYGIVSVQNFALPMMIGILAGFYSSFFLAPQLWVTWKTRAGKSGY
ncbi:protein translocase subunit SecF [Candidatus Nomurabacteria bacterium]|nr:protein translocase subunit SecF [Candidatus Nomurabacteria bacterium]